MDDIEVPPFFICPISLQIMKDPVTVSTGITYDRQSIEKWLFTDKHNTCPVTKQVLSPIPDLTPNHTVRRLIQSWCVLNISNGVDRIPTPKPPVTVLQIAKILHDTKLPGLQLKSLRALRTISSENDTNRRCIEASGALEFLVSLVIRNNSFACDDEGVSDAEGSDDLSHASDEALGILYNLKISESGLRSIVARNNVQELIDSLTNVMQRGNYESRVHAIFLLEALLEVADPIRLISLSPEFYIELVQILNDQISHQATKATLQLLIKVCPWGRNRVKAVEAGAVTVLIELILERLAEKRVIEMMLIVLEKLCACAEGRADLLKHGAGLAVVSKKILRVSGTASERGVRILSLISRFSATPCVLQDMLQLGVVSKLCLVLQVDCGNKTREKAREILKLHARAWKNSPCIPMSIHSSYP